MTNTPFSKQVEIVADFYLNIGWEHEDLLEQYDLGFPIAVAIANGGVDEKSLTDTGRAWIEETFIGICDKFDLDIYGDYDSLDNMIELSYEEG